MGHAHPPRFGETMATGAVGNKSRRFDNLFFPGMAVIILATVFIGFARTYYLAGAFRAPLPNLLVHIHGAVFSVWILLLIAQTSPDAAGRVDLHRRLGLLGFGVACLVVILGLMAATDGLVRHFAPGEKGVGVKAFYAVPIADMLVFATLIYFGFRERLNPAAHKRFMLIATIAILDAAFVRWPIPAAWWHLPAAQMCCYALLLLLVGYDLWSAGRIQRATLWGQLVSDRAAPGTDAHWANGTLAELRHVGAELRSFFPLSVKTNSGASILKGTPACRDQSGARVRCAFTLSSLLRAHQERLSRSVWGGKGWGSELCRFGKVKFFHLHRRHYHVERFFSAGAHRSAHRFHV